jgi:hypothetical protein
MATAPWSDHLRRRNDLATTGNGGSWCAFETIVVLRPRSSGRLSARQRPSKTVSPTDSGVAVSRVRYGGR